MKPKANPQSGSVLITAVIFGFAVATAVAGYLLLANNTMRMANRTLHLNSTMNLAEAGVEVGLNALTTFKPLGTSAKNYAAFTGWETDIDGDGDGVALDARRIVSGFQTTQQGTLGEFAVIVTHWELINEVANPPKIIVRARSNIANEGTIEKVVLASTANPSGSGSNRRALLGGIIAKKGVEFNGNTGYVDSYDSRENNGQYDVTTNRSDAAIVASASVGVDLGNADVWGVVATNGSEPDVGPNGTIGPFGTSPGPANVDEESVRSDFEANFLQVAQPSAPVGAITSISKTGDNYVLGVVGATTPTVYSLSGNITLTGNEKIIIQGPVQLIHSGNIRASGTNTAVVIQDTALDGLSSGVPALEIYIDGDLTLTGGGVVNPLPGTPGAVMIWGTASLATGSSGTQTIEIKGGPEAQAAIYAPNADVTITGNAEFYGAITGYSVSMSGTTAFHYDVALGDGSGGGGGPTGSLKVARWLELTNPAQRAGYDWGIF